MVKGIACTVLVGSLAVMFACSSKSSSTPSDSTDDASSTSDDGGSNSGSSSSSSSSSGGGGGDDSSTASCDDPIGSFASLTGMTVSSACKTCFNSKCATEVTTCQTEDCTTCAPSALSCAQSSCDKQCFPTPDGGSSSGDASGGGGDGSAPDCAKLASCNGCTYVNIAEPGMMAACMSAISSNSDATCTGYLAAIHAFSASLCP
jgi:hypothetical protein